MKQITFSDDDRELHERLGKLRTYTNPGLIRDHFDHWIEIASEHGCARLLGVEQPWLKRRQRMKNALGTTDRGVDMWTLDGRTVDVKAIDKPWLNFMPEYDKSFLTTEEKGWFAAFGILVFVPSVDTYAEIIGWCNQAMWTTHKTWWSHIPKPTFVLEQKWLETDWRRLPGPWNTQSQWEWPRDGEA